MKAVTLILGMLSFVCFSGGIANDLEVYNDAGLNFTLYLNGQKVNEVAKDKVVLTNTGLDIVHARVVFEDQSLPMIEKKYLMINFPWSSAEGNHPTTTVFKIKIKNGKYRLKKESRVYKPQGSHEELIFI
ncbi:MAG: hypothetical protein R2780_08645 [Crocinitomicaceae bacterium]